MIPDIQVEKQDPRYRLYNETDHKGPVMRPDINVLQLDKIYKGTVRPEQTHQHINTGLCMVHQQCAPSGPCTIWLHCLMCS